MEREVMSGFEGAKHPVFDGIKKENRELKEENERLKAGMRTEKELNEWIDAVFAGEMRKRNPDMWHILQYFKDYVFGGKDENREMGKKR